ncbi:MAG: hypothetical protein GY707_13295, partial [Desulfobacteraceae bacterium]|nr:hypothetical protein [Desulfobacteraceae bacterium]
MSFLNKYFCIYVLIFISLSISSCSNTDDFIKPDVNLLQSQDIVITTSEFIEELELRKAGYAYNIKDYPSEYNNIVLQVVKDLSEEIVLLHVAREKGII